MIHVKLTQNVGNWLTGTELGFIDLTHADAVLGGGTYVQTYPATPPTQQDLDAASAAAITYNTAHRVILGSEFDPVAASVTIPGPGQAVFGDVNGLPKAGDFWFNAIACGARADGATDDAPALQAVLDSINNKGGGFLFLPHGSAGGTYLVNSTLAIGSNTTIWCAPNVTIKLANAKNTYLLTNKDTTNGNTNIRVMGGTWDNNGANNQATQNYPAWPGSGILFVKVSGLTIRDSTHLGSPKFAVHLAGCTDFAVEHLTFNTISDGVHVQGQSARGRIEDLHGVTGDDFVAFTAMDYPYIQVLAGDITDMVVRDLYPNGGTGNAVKIVGGGSTKLRRITVDGVYGTKNNGAVAITDDINGLSPTDCDDITVQNIKCVSALGNPNVTLSCGAGKKITIRNLSHLATTPAYAAVRVVGSLTGVAPTIQRLLIDGLDSQVNTASVSVIEVTNIVVPASPPVITDLIVRNVTATIGHGAMLLSNVSANIARIVLEGIQTTGGRVYAVSPSATANTIHATNVQINGEDWGFDFRTSATLVLNNVTAQNLTGVIVESRGSGTVVRVIAGNVRAISGNGGVGNDTIGQVSVDGDGFPVAADKLTPQAYDRIYNSNAAALGGVGRYIRDSGNTVWKNIYTGTTY